MADYIERDCTIEHEGRKFESGGALVTDTHCIAYLGPCWPPYGESQHEVVGCTGELRTWHGVTCGQYRITHAWRTPFSYVSGWMFQIEAKIGSMVTLPARVYTGCVESTTRSVGVGMVFKGKRKVSDLH